VLSLPERGVRRTSCQWRNNFWGMWLHACWKKLPSFQKIIVPSSSLSAVPCFRGLRDSEGKDTTILRTVGNCLRIRTVWDPTRFDSSASSLWETQIASYHCFSLLAYICSSRYSCNGVLTFCNCNGAFEAKPMKAVIGVTTRSEPWPPLIAELWGLYSLNLSKQHLAL